MLKKKIFLLFITMVFLFTPLEKVSGKEGNILYQIYYFKGVKALNRKDYSLAIRQLKMALEKAPDAEKVKKALATALNNYSQSLGDEEREKAIELMEEAAEILPEEPVLKKNLSNLFNDWGLSLQKQKEFDRAIEKYKKAIEFSPIEDIYQKNLGIALAEKGNYFFNKGEFNEAIRKYNAGLQYIADNRNLWSMLGEAYYKIDNLAEAIDCWEEALRIFPEDEIISKKLAKAKKEWPVQKDFEEFSSSYFKIKFSPDFSRDKAYEVYHYVKDAIWSVGRDLGRYPKEKFSVFVYQNDEFEKLRGGKKHIAGFYDGKIHLNINEQITQKRIAELVRHEYTHAVIFWISAGKCPLWFNEGLACFEEKKDTAVDFSGLKKVAQKGQLIPLSGLSEECFQSADLKELSLAYQEAHSLAKYIIDEYGLWKIRKMLALFGEKKTEREVMKEVLRISPKELEGNWQRALKK